MNLTIQNFSKIAHADILVDGITVIAGDNNTGKSTVGKILFSMFNSLSNIEEKIWLQRLREIEKTSRIMTRNVIGPNGRNSAFFIRYSSALKKDLQRVMKTKDEITYQDIQESIERAFESLKLWGKELRESFEEISEELAEKIFALLNLPEEILAREVLTEYFQDVFNQQINSLIVENKMALVAAHIKNKKVVLSFEKNECVSILTELAILHKAVYIDNPFVVDKLSGEYDMNRMDEHLAGLLEGEDRAEIMDGVFERVLNKEKLENILRPLNTVIDGSIMQHPDGEFYLKREGFLHPVYFGNLSTGLKAFVILKRLLETAALKEKDVLILDEPEIHLHPKWQIVYAELVVLLQKSFDLSIVVTTHSPYFLDAIHLYSIKHKIDNKTNYYLSEMTDNQVTMENVTGNLDLIYQKMSTPIHELETLRYELNNGS